MSRRALTLAVSGVLVLVLAVLSMVSSVPYTEMTPGPTFNVLGTDPSTGQPNNPASQRPVIEVGIPANKTTGSLRMVTVGVTSADDQMNLFRALKDWLDPDTAVVPREAVYPDNQTQQQVQQQNAADFSSSENNATIAALCYAEDSQHAVQITTDGAAVTQLEAKSPASGKLQPGDVITAVDGTKVTASASAKDCPDRVASVASGVASLVQKHKPGDTTTLTVERGAQTLQVPIVTGVNPSNPQTAYVGVLLGPAFTKDGSAPATVDISLQDVGGPSAGLMFTLGVIDKVGNVDLAAGRVIAGTGTIDADGNVGEIGGVAMKVIAARRDGATVFLTPAANCVEAKQNPPAGLQLAKVTTLGDALNALALIRSGHANQVPTC